jgi:hypothetical protein
MANSDFYLGWKNSTGGYTISRRTANGKAMPSFSSSQIVQPVALQVPAPAWAKLSFSFSRPIEADNKILSTSPFIWGIASKAPSAVDDPKANFDIHDNYGTLPQVNFLSTTGSTASGSGSTTAIIKSTRSQYQTVLVAHGVLFFIAWFLAPLAAVFVARYLKEKIGIWWYRLHWGMMTFITGGLTSIGVLIVVLYKPTAHFDDPHSIIGLFMLIATWAQIALGFIINDLWTPTRTSIPWWDKMHWWFGRTVIIIGIANIFLGFNAYHELSFPIALNGMYIGFGVLVGLGVLLLVYGEVALGQTRKFIIIIIVI